MLTISLLAIDELPAVDLSLEHSLVSLSKWEEEHEKPFFGKEPITAEETADYIRCMVVGQIPPEHFLERLTREEVESITTYINASRTGTTFPPEPPGRGSAEIMTSELIYYWMISFKIPFYPCENWHLNRLLTLIRTCGVKQQKPKKQSTQDRAEQYRALNEQRRAQSGSAG